MDRGHEKAIDGVVDGVLRDAGISLSEVSAVAVTIGPGTCVLLECVVRVFSVDVEGLTGVAGLAFSLAVGHDKARRISQSNQIPFIAVNHLEVHARSGIKSTEKMKRRAGLLRIRLLVSNGGMRCVSRAPGACFGGAPRD